MINISDSIINVGVNDHKIKLFESQFPVPEGMAYNSYVILDEKIVVTDTVEESFKDEWFENLRVTLAGRAPDYLIVHHMEGDHSSNIQNFLEQYPSCKLVTSAVALNIIKCYFNTDYSDRTIVVKEGDKLELGKHTLQFIAAPMVHWPEVMMTYESSEKVLFSADAFGTFGANDVENEEPWDNEARRYYYGIVGKFGMNVQNVLKKASALDIETICSLHGPALTGDLEHVFYLYDVWSKYEAESNGVFIPYTSVYGHNEKVVQAFVDELEKAGFTDVMAMNLAENDVSEAMAMCYYYKNIIFATTTYNTGIFPLMDDLIRRLEDHNFCNRNVGFIENGSWAPAAARVMKEKLGKCANLNFIDGKITVKGSLNDAALASIKEYITKIEK